MIEFISAILVISILVFVHEFGHFIVAKACKVGVLTFSIGFGPKIIEKRWGSTLYKICAIPLGGYVRMVGDMPDGITEDNPTDDLVRHEDEGTLTDEEVEHVTEEIPEVAAIIADKSKWFIHKNYFQKSAIVFAGPLFNFIFAFLIVTTLAYRSGIIDPFNTIVSEVTANSPAEKAGFKSGDRVVAIDNVEVKSWIELSEIVSSSKDKSLEIKIERGSDFLTKEVIPEKVEIKSEGEEKIRTTYRIGVAQSRQQLGLVDSSKYAVKWITELSMQSYLMLFEMIKGNVKGDELAGPLTIMATAGDQAKKGLEEKSFARLFHFMALLSVSLAVLNLLPIPVLDGGHLLFFAIEAVFGPLSIKKKEMAQQFGMLIILALMVFAISNDLQRLFSGNLSMVQ